MINIGNSKLNVEYSDINETNPTSNILSAFEIIIKYLLDIEGYEVNNYIAKEMYDYVNEELDENQPNWKVLENILNRFGVNTFKVPGIESAVDIQKIEENGIGFKLLYLVEITVQTYRGTYSRITFLNPGNDTNIIKLNKESLVDSKIDIYNMPGSTISFNSLYLISMSAIN